MITKTSRILEAQNFGVRVGTQTVLKSVNLVLHRGMMLVILGVSGSGKTSLLKSLAGIIPHQGNLTVRAKIGMIFQESRLFPWLTAGQNIAFGIAEKSKREQAEIIEIQLKAIGLMHKQQSYPAELSGGESQRVSFARTFATDPDIVLMDEPFGALDTQNREQMQQWLLDVQKASRKSIIFVTHDTEEALLLADRLMILEAQTLHEIFYDTKAVQAAGRFSSIFNFHRAMLHEKISSSYRAFQR